MCQLIHIPGGVRRHCEATAAEAVSPPLSKVDSNFTHGKLWEKKRNQEEEGRREQGRQGPTEGRREESPKKNKNKEGES